jgi:putative nucleotidyltransferase with HDIG domain
VKRILFVDDEPRVLQGLERMLYSLRKEWSMVFVSSGRQALELLAESDFDVLVTDMRMPGMTGGELLEQVVSLHPQVVRMVLSGTADQEITLHSVGLAHQYLAKPCDVKVLRTTVERALSLRLILDDPQLKRLIAGIRSLPSVPAIYFKLVESLRSPDSSAASIGAIIAQDPGMTAKILQLVNSAFFGLKRRIADPVEAVIYVGVDVVRSLALTSAVFSHFDSKSNPGFRIEELRDHSVAVATLARQIAKSMALSTLATDDAFAGGLMHDIGKLVLGCNFPDRYREVMNEQDPGSIREAETRIFGANHPAVGGYLLWLWGLPESVTEIVICHHLERNQEALLRGGAELDRARDHADRLKLIRFFPDWESRAGELILGGHLKC